MSTGISVPFSSFHCSHPDHTLVIDVALENHDEGPTNTAIQYMVDDEWIVEFFPNLRWGEVRVELIDRLRVSDTSIFVCVFLGVKNKSPHNL